MMKTLTGCLITLTVLSAIAADSQQFRGPNRDGQFEDTGLMRSWSESGPKELWSIDGLGEGYSSLAIAAGKIYVNGTLEEKGYLWCYDLQGKRLWEASTGHEHDGGGFPGAKSTPTVDGDYVYMLNTEGRLYSFNAKTGKENWMVDFNKAFEATETPHFGYSESVLIDGDKLICTPGGKDAALAALDKKTGKIIWTTKGLEDSASYCSIRIFDNGKIRQYITLTGKYLIGVDTKDGSLQWQHHYKAAYNIHAVSPVFHGNSIYVSDGYNQGGKMVELAADGKSVKELWKEKTLDCHHGGLVGKDGFAYGASSKGKWMCLDLSKGQVVQSIDGVGKGAAVYADGMIIAYGENGDVGLINADPKDFKLLSSFKVEKGSGQHWAHPVLQDGKLYVRHGSHLMAYAVK